MRWSTGAPGDGARARAGQLVAGDGQRRRRCSTRTCRRVNRGGLCACCVRYVNFTIEWWCVMVAVWCVCGRGGEGDEEREGIFFLKEPNTGERLPRPAPVCALCAVNFTNFGGRHGLACPAPALLRSCSPALLLIVDVRQPSRASRPAGARRPISQPNGQLRASLSINLEALGPSGVCLSVEGPKRRWLPAVGKGNAACA
jgi:hypothetical protein